MKHFVYRITAIEPIDGFKYYYGKRSGEFDDLGIKYFTSSKKLNRLFRKNPENFKSKIVMSFNTSNEACIFESKIHAKLNVKDHKLFFNQSNQTISGKFDRTGKVSVINLESNERETIDVEEFYKEKEKYRALSYKKVLTKNLNSEAVFLTNLEDFKNNDNLYGVNKGLVYAINKEKDKLESVTTDIFKKNRENFIFSNEKNVVCIDLTNNEKKRVSIEAFRTNDNLVGVRFNKESRKEICKYCNKEISFENIKSHEKSHENKLIFITDNENLNTIKIKESEYFLNFKDTHYITSSGMFIYKEGEIVRKRKKKTGEMVKQECKYCGKLIGGVRNFRNHIKNHEKEEQNEN